ncbi:MAG TPA: hypothetical protein VGS20_13020 [Candidatus Acidoferrales bacterium]|nr:hypothetical protein [Candidatus Acidoferrales bacterium]
MNGSWLVLAALALLALLAYLGGIFLVWMPRQCAVICEVFAASGNLPSFLPRSVRAAVIEMRVFGFTSLALALLFVRGALTPHWTRLLLAAPADIPNPSWLVFPGLLAILAGYTLAAEGAPRVTQMMEFWMDHPLVPRSLIPAMSWALRLIGLALILFGAGVFWTWLSAAVR